MSNQLITNTSNTCQLLERSLEFNGQLYPIDVRSDGYVNVTKICRICDKDIYNWKKNERTVSLLNSYSKKYNLTIEELIISKKGGKHEGTYAHPKLAIQIAQWCSDEFAMQVDDWVYELLTVGKVELNKNLLESEKDKRISELERELADIHLPLNYDEYIYALNVDSNGNHKYGKAENLITRLTAHKKTYGEDTEFIQTNKVCNGLYAEYLLKYSVLPFKLYDLTKPDSEITETEKCCLPDDILKEVMDETAVSFDKHAAIINKIYKKHYMRLRPQLEISKKSLAAYNDKKEKERAEKLKLKTTKSNKKKLIISDESIKPYPILDIEQNIIQRTTEQGSTIIIDHPITNITNIVQRTIEQGSDITNIIPSETSINATPITGNCSNEKNLKSFLNWIKKNNPKEYPKDGGICKSSVIEKLCFNYIKNKIKSKEIKNYSLLWSSPIVNMFCAKMPDINGDVVLLSIDKINTVSK